MAGNTPRCARTRRVGERRPGDLRCWTLEGLDIWRRLSVEGSLRCEPNGEILVDSFPAQYDWLRQQLASRLPGYDAYCPWKVRVDHKPDLRFWSINLEPVGAQWVRMELSITPERTVLF